MKTKKFLIVFVSVIALVVLCSFAVGAVRTNDPNPADGSYGELTYNAATGYAQAITGFTNINPSYDRYISIQLYINYTDGTFDSLVIVNDPCYGTSWNVQKSIFLFADLSKTVLSVNSEHCVITSNGGYWDGNLTIYP